MKKIVLFLSTAVLCGMCFASPFPENAEKVEYMELRCGTIKTNEASLELSKAEVETDLDAMVYLLKTSYAGYEDAVARGLDLEKWRYDRSIFFQNQERFPGSVNILSFTEGVFGDLCKYISDLNFGFVSEISQTFSSDKFRDVCFTDVYVEKQGDEYIVSKSGTESVKAGQKYTGSTDNVFYYPSKGENIYRLGTLSGYFRKQSTEVFSFDGKDVPLEFHNDIRLRRSNKPGCTLIGTQKSGYVSFSSCNTRKLLEKFENSGKSFQNKDFVILDSRGSGDVSTTAEINFLRNLYISKSELQDSSAAENYSNLISNEVYSVYDNSEVLTSPLTALADYNQAVEDGNKKEISKCKKLLTSLKKNPVKFVEIKNPHELKTGTKGSLPAEPCFKGKLIILTDKNTEYVEEEFYLFAKKLFKDQVVLCGKNTAGSLTYNFARGYYLPASDVGVIVPGVKNNITDPSWKGEERGFYPDVWSETKDMNETVVAITGDEALRGKF